MKSQRANGTGWRSLPSDGRCVHIMNGVVVNEGAEASLRSGKILIQSEGAEIYYRKIEINEDSCQSANGRLLRGRQPVLLCRLCCRVKDWHSTIFVHRPMGYTARILKHSGLFGRGRVTWQYAIPNKDRNNVLSEFSDIHQLSNGHILYACKTGCGRNNTR